MAGGWGGRHFFARKQEVEKDGKIGKKIKRNGDGRPRAQMASPQRRDPVGHGRVLDAREVILCHTDGVFKGYCLT